MRARSVQGTAVVLVLLAAGVLVVGRHQLASSASFLPALLAVVAVLDVLGLLLLQAQFRAEGDPRAWPCPGRTPGRSSS